MQKSVVDRLDIEILRFLCKNPKQSCREIAKHLDVSDRTVARRIARMESEGIILGYQPVLNDYVKGMLFDVDELTEVKFSISEWANFEEALREMYSTASEVILFHAGKGIGRAIFRNMNISKMSVNEALSGFSKICALRGWGNIRFEKIGNDLIKVDIKHLKINPSMFRGVLTSLIENMVIDNFEVSYHTDDGNIIIRVGGG